MFRFTHLLHDSGRADCRVQSLPRDDTAHGPLAVDDARPRQLQRVSHQAGVPRADAGRVAGGRSMALGALRQRKVITNFKRLRRRQCRMPLKGARWTAPILRRTAYSARRPIIA